MMGTPAVGTPNLSSAPGAGAAVITDSAVPEGHKGLHATLYGDKGADAHEQEGSSRGYLFRRVRLPLLCLSSWCFSYCW